MQQLAPARRSGGLPQHGLVSLWDMYEFNAVEWIELIEHLGSIQQRSERELRPNAQFTDEARAKLPSGFDHLSKLCEQIGLETAKEIAAESARECRKADYDPHRYVRDVETLKRTVLANMRAIRFMRVSPEFARYLDAYDDVIGACFPDASADLDDAGRALAFDLGTAAVFHCMRVMEAGLRLLANDLGIPYAPSWESYLKQMNDRFGMKWKDKPADWKQHEDYYREVTGDLQSVKFAWRNPTMHIERDYSQAEAREVYSAVLTFMRRLAESPSLEDGQATTS